MITFTMTTAEELKKKAGKFDPDHFNWIVASEEIKMKGNERDNIAFMPSIIPPKEITRFMDERFNKYYGDYLRDVLSYPIAVLMKAALDNDYSVVFVCTETELAVGYLPLFMEFISEFFDIPTGKFKKLIKGTSEFTLTAKDIEVLNIELDKIIKEKGNAYKDITLFYPTHKTKDKKKKKEEK